MVTVEFGREQDYGTTGESRPLKLELFKEILVWVLISIPTSLVILGVIHGIRLLLDRTAQKKKHDEPKDAEGLRVERLDEEELRKKKEKLSGWEKRLRRRYEKLILRRTPGTAALHALTPTELERAAGLRGPAAQTVHRLYSETRYSPVPADRERYAAFKEAARALEASAPRQPADKP